MRAKTLFKPSALVCFLCFLCALGEQTFAAQLPNSTPVVIPTHLSLDTALRLFHEHGLDLLLAEAQVQDARADVQAAGALPNPAFSVSFGRSFGYNPMDSAGCPDGRCSAQAFGVGVSDQAIWDLLTGRRGLRLAVAKNALAAARLNFQDAKRTLVFQLQQQYLSAALFQMEVAFYLEMQRAGAQTLSLLNARYHSGAISEAEQAKAETSKLQSDQALSTARQNLRLAELALAFLLGARAPISELTLDTDMFRARPSDPLSHKSSSELLQIALQNRPDLHAAFLRKLQAEQSIERVLRNRLPDVTISAQYTQQGTGQYALQPPTLTGSLGITLPLLYQSQGELAHAQSNSTTQTLAYEKLLAQVVTDVESGQTALRGAQERIDILENRMLERARTARDLVRLQYQRGATSLLEYLDAQRTYSATQIQYFEEIERYFTAVFQLEQAVAANSHSSQGAALPP